MYTTLLFDVDDTLLDFKQDSKNAFKLMCDALNINYSTILYDNYLQINKERWLAFEQGLIGREAVIIGRFEELFLKYSINFDPKAANDLYFECLGAQCKKMKYAQEVIEQLANSYDLYIITNGVKAAQDSRLELSGFKKYFSDIFISEELGFNKPDPNFFSSIAPKLQEKALNKILIIGDSITSDIQLGLNVGIDTCLLSNNASNKATYSIKSLCELLNILEK